MTATVETHRRSARSDRRVIVPLLLLSLIPVVAGAVRLVELGGGEVNEDNARFFASPVPVVLHIVSASLYCLLGAFQFAPGFRRRHPLWHRRAGRILIPAGLLAAVTGLWMTLFYSLPDHDGALLAGFRLLFGSAMAGSILLGLAAIRRRDFAAHRAWMIRGYAIGQGAGTQVLTHLPWMLLAGAPGEVPRALLMGAGWAINLVVAEWLIQRGGSQGRRKKLPPPT